jgi:hypothetical protein
MPDEPAPDTPTDADPAPNPEPEPDTPEPATGDGDGATDPDGDTFPRTYVEELRRESAGYRERAGRADAALDRLAQATIREATAGILADPTDLTFDAESMADDDGWPDPEKIAQAARDLVGRKPHLGDRRPTGDVGQGARTGDEPVDLAGMLRARA